MFQIILSKTAKPQLNLAFEEYLVKNADENSNIFFLWQNDETVVIGRNQNPWNECSVNSIKEDNIHLVRRLTGGGAVFHDLGNLNFTFISKNTEGKIEDNFEIVNSALKEFGINSVFTGKNDLLVGDKKISGNAFVVEGQVLCHHGTLLVEADLTRLSKYLRVSDLKLKSKGIESVLSRVSNLTAFNKDIDVELIKQSLIEKFKAYFKIDNEIIVYGEEEICEILEGFTNRYYDWNWNYGSSPAFEVSFKDRFSWGEIEINFNIEDARIKEVKIYSDSNEANLSQILEKKIIGERFDKQKLIKAISSLSLDHMDKDMVKKINRDLVSLFEEKMF